MKPFQLFYKILVITAFAMLFQTCVDPIGFDQQADDTLLVVDGKINANASEQTVLLTRTDVIGKSANFPPEAGATITLLENNKLIATYTETEPGVYKIFNFKPRIGNSYQVNVRLVNGEQYASEPQLLPKQVPIDSAYFTFDGARTLTLFTKITIPTEGEVPYLRGRIEHVYQHTDIYCGGLDDVKTCYYELNRATDNQLIPILDGSALERGLSVPFTVAQANVIDSIFGEVTYYTIFQESITLNTFRYWEKVQQLLEQSGSIFDAPPGQIRGNIYKIDEPEKLVLGFFYATSEEVAYVKTVPIDFLPLQLAPYCGIPGIFPNPFPDDCCVCRFGIPRPDYW